MELNIELLKQDVELESEISVDLFIRKVFVRKNITEKSSVSKILFHLFKIIYSINNDEEGIELISNFLKNENIKSVFKYKKKGNLIKENLSFEKGSCEINFSKINKIERDRLIMEVSKGVGGKGFGMIADEELIRYLYSLVHYEHSHARTISIIGNFSYGLFPVRDKIWAHNKLYQMNQLLVGKKNLDFDENKVYFLKIMKGVKEWSPEKFLISDRLKYFSEKNITLTEEALRIYKGLVEIDNARWWSSDIRNQIALKSCDEIFYAAVKNAHSDLNVKLNINNWALEELEFTIPIKAEAVPVLELEEEESSRVYDDGYDFYEQTPCSPIETFDDFKKTSFKIITDKKYFHKLIIPKIIIRNKKNVEEKIILPLEKKFKNNGDEYFFTSKFNTSNQCLEKNDFKRCAGSNETGIKNSLYTYESDSSSYKEPAMMDMDWSPNNCDSDNNDNSEENFFLQKRNNFVNNEKNFENFYKEFTSTSNSKNIEENLEKAKDYEIIIKNEVKEHHLCSEFLDLERIKNTNLEFEKFEKKLFNRYRYTSFFKSDAFSKIFTSSQRPSKTNWNYFIDELVEKKILSEIKQKVSYVYKFNLEVPRKSKTLSYTYVFELFTKAIKNSKTSDITLAKLRSQIKLNLRPSLHDWEKYFEDLLTEKGYISLSKVVANAKFYTIK